MLSDDTPVSTFRCSGGVGFAELQRFLYEDASYLHREHLATTTVCLSERTVIGYVTYGLGSLRLELPDAANMGIDDYEGDEVPCLTIYRLAVADLHRRAGVGSLLVRHVFQEAADLRETLPCRLITVAAYADAAGFYEKFGFEMAGRTLQWRAFGVAGDDESDNPECVFMLANLGPRSDA